MLRRKLTEELGPECGNHIIYVRRVVYTVVTFNTCRIYLEVVGFVLVVLIEQMLVLNNGAVVNQDHEKCCKDPFPYYFVFVSLC